MKTSMDAIQFGKWMSERRRKRGWSSQRALVETIRQDHFLKDVRISEDFLARLEAGRLAYPFRGYVRWQVLALAWLLCSTPREVQAYLQAASLKDLSAEEHEWVQQLYAHVSRQAVAAIELLPVRPQRLVGQETLVQEVLNQLCTLEHGVCALTGMPGVGKSALASEVLHRLVADGYSRIFHHGIITISCKGRRGTQGLLSLLHEVISILLPAQEQRPLEQSDSSLAFWLDRMETHLASVIDRVRVLLMDKSILFLLDDLDAQFPLRTALDALLGSTRRNTVHSTGQRRSVTRHVVLTTSRHIPSPALVNYHHHVQPLLHTDACALFHTLTASMTAATPLKLDEEQEQAVGQICQTVGYLPLTIELVANAVAVRGIPLDLLATNAAFDPFHPLLDNSGELGALFEQAFSNIGHEQHKHFALLSLLGPQAFSLEAAAALFQHEKWGEESTSFEPISRSVSARTGRSTTTELERPSEPGSHRNSTPELTRLDNPYVPFQTLTSTALELGYLVNDSLLERVTTEAAESHNNQQQYMLHPLLYAYARNCVQRLPARYLDSIWSNFQAYMACLYR
ncbi:ATP-binding protein [Dictyobacter formicarum]|uniref:ATP-binding protein n=1 Tax=Dictyobacter formicarum TaxID=2778368 RepID=UPI001916BEFD|nr:ATP-binding protein [Dictyobacter formicarum]